MRPNLKLYNVCMKLPAGSTLFSFAIGFVAPYFATIKPKFESLKPSYARLHMPYRRKVTNHIKTVHAIAMCNMAELAGGMMTDVSVPKTSKWIPVDMKVWYLKKAKTSLTAEADGAGIDWNTEGNVLVPVSVKDTSGEEVFRAEIRMNLRH